MRGARALGLGLGTVVAAATAGVVVERRVVKARKAGARGADVLGGLTATPRTVRTDDGVALHVEVDEVAPYASRPAAADDATVVFVHGYALNLDCWHFQRAFLRGKRRLVFYDQRSHGRSGRSTPGHATIDQLGHDLARVLDAGGTRGAGRPRRPLDGRDERDGPRRAATPSCSGTGWSGWR